MKIGILGAGQLAQMLAQAGKHLGIECKFLCPDETSCAQVYGELICADYDDPQALQQLADWADVITYEFENIPDATVAQLSERATVHPSLKAIAISSDRLQEKQMFNRLGIETAQFENVESLAQLEQAVATIGVPSILKTRREGYDGKGQRVIKDGADLAAIWSDLGQVPCILESMVPFSREISVIAARGVDGNVVFWPVAENTHREGILRLSLCTKADPYQAQAEQMIEKLLHELNYVGVLTLELFQLGEQLVANEIAPRVHNSGHWTIDGASTSQFENHLRAVAGMELPKPELLAPSAMINLIGTLPDADKVDGFPETYSHIYGKAEREGRKIGHINVVAQTLSSDQFSEQVKQLLALIGEDEIAGSFNH